MRYSQLLLWLLTRQTMKIVRHDRFDLRQLLEPFEGMPAARRRTAEVRRTPAGGLGLQVPPVHCPTDLRMGRVALPFKEAQAGPRRRWARGGPWSGARPGRSARPAR